MSGFLVLEDPLDRPTQLMEVQRFDQEVDCSLPHGRRHGRKIVEGRHHDDGGAGKPCLEDAEEIEATHTRHSDVHQRDIGRRLG